MEWSAQAGRRAFPPLCSSGLPALRSSGESVDGLCALSLRLLVSRCPSHQFPGKPEPGTWVLAPQNHGGTLRGTKPHLPSSCKDRSEFTMFCGKGEAVPSTHRGSICWTAFSVNPCSYMHSNMFLPKANANLTCMEIIYSES